MLYLMLQSKGEQKHHTSTCHGLFGNLTQSQCLSVCFPLPGLQIQTEWHVEPHVEKMHFLVMKMLLRVFCMCIIFVFVQLVIALSIMLLVFLLQQSLVITASSVTDRRLGLDVLTGLLGGHATITVVRALTGSQSHGLTWNPSQETWTRNESAVTENMFTKAKFLSA